MQSRYTAFVLCILMAVVGGLIVLFWPSGRIIVTGGWISLIVFGLLTVVGVIDLAQRHHSIQRNYPVIGHIRWMVEYVRPEIRQYLIEADQDAAPFSRSQRAIVYQRAKGEAGERPFGTLLDVYREGYEYIAHSMNPAIHADPTTFRITIGNDQCARPYSASVFNVSAMSFGSLSANAIRALNKGAKLGGFAHDTGEGSISAYHREYAGDIIWELASGYFGCRGADEDDRDQAEPGRQAGSWRRSAGG
jgi:glutamate synthase domain-containing protein 2